MLTRNKFKQSNPSSHQHTSERTSRRTESYLDPELEEARPASVGEEEMQLQIALALSREESEKADEMRKSDEVRLQIALEESRAEADKMANTKQGTVNSGQLTQSALDDLLSLGVGELVLNEQSTSSSSTSAWGAAPINDPWALPQPVQSTQPLPPAQSSVYPTASLLGNDPWAPTSIPASVAPPAATVVPEPSADPFAAWEQTLEPTPALTPALASEQTTNGSRKTPENFLGENSNLVNLDNLLGSTVPTNGSNPNPFMLGTQPPPANPFTAAQRKSPTLNEMRAAQQAPPIPSAGPRVGALPQPLQPTSVNPFANPF